MNEDEVTTNEQTTDVEQTTAEPEEQQQLPADASPDDLTLEEIVQTNDDDFEAYQKGEITAAAIREKYNFETPTDEKVEKTEQTTEETTSKEETSSSNAEIATNSPEDAQTSINYEEVWKKISAPFKANGKMYQPQTPEDIVNLMQKGVNYTQKMQAIAPARKTFETLNKNKIDANELNFLIDLHNGNKDAIKELLKRNKYEANSFDEAFGTDTNNTPYVPRNNFITDQESQINDILNDVQDNTAKISDIVLNKWDQASRDLINQHPEIIRALNEEINLGRFDEIQAAVENAKMFGRTQGLSDLQAYCQFARQYEAYQQQQQQQAVQQQQQQQIAANNAASKRAAAPTRGQSRAAKRKMTTEDLWNMSDEDFEKLKYTDIQAMEQ